MFIETVVAALNLELKMYIYLRYIYNKHTTSNFAPSLLSLLFITNSAVSKRQAKQLAVEKVIDLGLEVNVAAVILIELSSGMKKRLSLVRAIAPLLKTDSVIYNNTVPTSQHTQSECITENQPFIPPPRYHYFDVVVGLACSNDRERYAGVCLATGRDFHVRQGQK
jgi:hypothetical protein